MLEQSLYDMKCLDSWFMGEFARWDSGLRFLFFLINIELRMRRSYKKSSVRFFKTLYSLSKNQPLVCCENSLFVDEFLLGFWDGNK